MNARSLEPPLTAYTSSDSRGTRRSRLECYSNEVVSCLVDMCTVHYNHVWITRAIDITIKYMVVNARRKVGYCLVEITVD